MLKRLLRVDHFSEEMASAVADMILPDPEPHTIQISEYYAGKLGDLLSVEKRNESDLVDIIANANERLRQTRLVIASLEPAQAALAGDIAQ